jgi:uncharacterized phage protein (TIGR01671 family)
MMRFFKFRAWDNIRKKMINVGRLDFDLTGEHRSIYNVNRRIEGHSLGYLCCPLMQSTGLLDKHGVEIYEGDIIRHKNGLCDGEVRYWEGAFIAGTSSANSALVNYNVLLNIEVIGNIHEHLELLKPDA